MAKIPNNGNRLFWESAKNNTTLSRYYYNRLINMYLSRFEWKNMPETVDVRFLELCLFASGMCVFFKDDGGLGYLTLRTMINGPLNVYNLPTKRKAYAANGYTKDLTEDDSVIIFNDYMHLPSLPDIEVFANSLAEIASTINVNVKAQKTPVLIKCNETQRMTMMNLYKQYDGNQPYIFADKAMQDKLEVLKTDAPFIAMQLQDLFTAKWNEALTYLGIGNLTINKKERVITDEVQKSQGGTIASRFSALGMRQIACEQINNMFGLDISCEFREDVVSETDSEIFEEVKEEEVIDDE